MLVLGWRWHLAASGRHVLTDSGRELASSGVASQVQAGCSSWQTCMQHAAGSCQPRRSGCQRCAGHEMQRKSCKPFRHPSPICMQSASSPSKLMQPAGHLHACCAGVDWRQKLDAQRGAVLATELKNNANKLARWTAAAMISGTELIKLGYISRHHPRENRHHTILGTQVSFGSGLCRALGPLQSTTLFWQTDKDWQVRQRAAMKGLHPAELLGNTPTACRHVLSLCVDRLHALPLCVDSFTAWRHLRNLGMLS